MSNQFEPETQVQLTIVSDDDKAINHYEKLREDVRSEIKMRISQRDNFAIQLITTLGLLCTLGFADKGYIQVLIIAPLLSIYYTMQILYSYRLHDVLATYLRTVLEPQLAHFCKTDLNHEWENFYKNHAKPGIRRGFFLWAMWVVCTLSLTYLVIDSVIRHDLHLLIVIIVAIIIYFAAMIYITWTFIGDINKKGKVRHERLPETSTSNL